MIFINEILGGNPLWQPHVLILIHIGGKVKSLMSRPRNLANLVLIILLKRHFDVVMSAFGVKVPS